MANLTLRGSVACRYSSSDRLCAEVNVDSEWNGQVPIVCIRHVDGTPWWSQVVATTVSDGKFTIWISGNFVSGHIVHVEYLFIKYN